MYTIQQILLDTEGEYSISQQRLVRGRTGSSLPELHKIKTTFLGIDMEICGLYETRGPNVKNPYSITIKGTSEIKIKAYPRVKLTQLLLRIIYPERPVINHYYYFSSTELSQRIQANSIITKYLLKYNVSILSNDRNDEIEILIHSRYLSKEQLLELADLGKNIIKEIKASS